MPEKPQMQRGSAKILHERFGARKFNEAQLKEFVNSIDMEGVRITDYFPRGIPEPDVIYGTLHVSPQMLGSVLDRLLKNNVAWGKLEVFPKGIPALDEILINFESFPGYH